MRIREITESVMAHLENGRTRKEIYASLVEGNPKEAGKIAYCVTSVPDPGLRKKYLYHNALLCLFLVTYSALSLIDGLPIGPEEPTIFLALATLVPLIFAYFVFHFFGGVYRLAGIWFLIDLFETILLRGAPDGIAVLRLLTLFFIVVLSFLLARKIFPLLGLWGPKKDVSGNYLF